MFSYIDTHCHLDSTCKKLQVPNFTQLKADYFSSDLKACVHVSCDPNSINTGLNLIEEPNIWGAFAIHPHDAKDYSEEVENKLLEASRHPKHVAWGEMGLDYHYLFSPIEIQKQVFIRQIQLALSVQKPMVIHTREAEADTLDIMKQYIPSETKIHVHCFTSSENMAKELLNSFPNLVLGFTGVITFKNTEALKQVVRNTPLTRILLETDAPYLAPVPHRGKPCHSGYIPIIAEEIAKIKEIPLETIFNQTLINSKNFYGIP